MVVHKSRMSELSFHSFRGDAYNFLFFASRDMKVRKLQRMPIEIQSPTPSRGIVVHPRLFPSPLSKFWLSSGRVKVVLPWRCSLAGVWEVESWTRDGVSRGRWCAKNAPASRFISNVGEMQSGEVIKPPVNSSSIISVKWIQNSLYPNVVNTIEKCLIIIASKFFSLSRFSASGWKIISAFSNFLPLAEIYLWFISNGCESLGVFSS